MEQDIHNEKTEQNKIAQKKGYLNRRDILKALATVPILGVFFQKLYKKISLDTRQKNQIFAELGMENELPYVLPSNAVRLNPPFDEKSS